MSETDTATAREITVYYEKSRFFRVIHVDGAFGGISPQASPSGLDITVSFYSERWPIPKEAKLTIDKAGHKSETKSNLPPNKEGIFREVEVCAIFNISQAKALHSWLERKIAEAEGIVNALREQQSEHPEPQSGSPH